MRCFMQQFRSDHGESLPASGLLTVPQTLSAGAGSAVTNPPRGGRIAEVRPEFAVRTACPYGIAGKSLTPGRLGADTDEWWTSLLGKPSHGPETAWKTSAVQPPGGHRARCGDRLGQRPSPGRSALVPGTRHRLRCATRRRARPADRDGLARGHSESTNARGAAAATAAQQVADAGAAERPGGEVEGP